MGTKSFSEGLAGDYDRVTNINYIELLQSRMIDSPGKPRVTFEGSCEVMGKFDVLEHSRQIPLVSKKLASLLEECCGNSIQFIPAEVICRDGCIEDYSFINILNSEEIIDLAESSYVPIPGTQKPMTFRQVEIRSDAFQEHEIGRDLNYKSPVFVSERLANRIAEVVDRRQEFLPPQKALV